MRSGRPSWENGYSLRLRLTDVLVVILSVVLSQLIAFGATGATGANLAITERSNIAVGYTVVSAVLAAAWLIALELFATRDVRVIGSGTDEYRRVANATFALFGFFAVVAYLGNIALARSYLLTALPLGLFLLVFSRWLWRQWLHSRRSKGDFMSSVLLVGARQKVEHVAHSIAVERSAGLVVVAALIPRGKRGDTVGGIPVLGGLADIVAALEESGAETIVLTDSDDLPHTAVRTLSWDLESRGVNLIVVPALTDVAGPRIHARPVSGLPLIHVEFPIFEGPRHIAKRAFDWLAAIAGLVILSPLFLVVTIAVKAETPGPALFRQERVGINGKSFRMLKFRSMNSDAEAQLASLLDKSEGNGVLFKLRNDPRVTRVGAFLRRHSIDELPQIINVIRGEMSLVGPRPPLASEVAQYDDATRRRRLLVKPGITGLWQVSGRSNLSWDDSVRLDLYYVENWSLTGDLIILYRTVRAVLKPHGAY